MKNADRPWVSNYPPLNEWLQKVGAFCNWQMMRGPEKNPTQAVECWTAHKRIFIIIVHGNERGWEIYTDGGTNKVNLTLLDAEARMEIASEGKGDK